MAVAGGSHIPVTVQRIPPTSLFRTTRVDAAASRVGEYRLRERAQTVSNREEILNIAACVAATHFNTGEPYGTHGTRSTGKSGDHHLADHRDSVLAGGAVMCYGQPETNPAKHQTEAGRTAQHYNNANNVPPYSNVAGEREQKRRAGK